MTNQPTCKIQFQEHQIDCRCGKAGVADNIVDVSRAGPECRYDACPHPVIRRIVILRRTMVFRFLCHGLREQVTPGQRQQRLKHVLRRRDDGGAVFQQLVGAMSSRIER
jgi:hypothetical protein